MDLVQVQLRHRLQGELPLLPQAIAGADDFLTGKFGQQRLTEPLPRADELPLAFAIVNFSD